MVVVITGASRGLGRTLALRFGREQHRIVVNYLTDRTAAEAVAAEVRAVGGEAVTGHADVGDPAQVSRLVEETCQAWATVDVLIANAGIPGSGLVTALSGAVWDGVMRTNLTGAFHCTQAVAPVMQANGRGQIILISSLVGLQGRAGAAAYAASKAGLLGLTKALARELGSSGIQVNAVLPGWLPTTMGQGLNPAYREAVLHENVLGRPSTLEEVADFIYGLTGLRHVSGQVFQLDSRIP